jgi:hypothetical protein
MGSSLLRLVALVAFLLSFVDLSVGFWRLPCHGRTGVARIDPLVDFDKVGDHAHVIHGGKSKSWSLFYRVPLCTIIYACSLALGLKLLLTILPFRLRVHLWRCTAQPVRLHFLRCETRLVGLLDPGFVFHGKRRQGQACQSGRRNARVS